MNTLRLVLCGLATLSQSIAAPGGLYHEGGYHGPLAIPHVLPDGHLADTHEVAAAKAEHFSAVAKAAAHSGHGAYGGHGGGYGGSSYSGGYAGAYSHDDHDGLRYHGPIAVPHVLHDGHIADTHEVAAAKAEHFAAVAKAKAHGGHGGGYHGDDAGYHGDYDGRYAGGYGHGGFSGAFHGGAGYVGAYHGPLAKPVVLPNGYLADTHEVAAAKGHHLSALASAHHHSAAHAYHH